jgi:hypothetical protein
VGKHVLVIAVAVLLLAAPAASANDASSAPTPLASGVAATADTRGFGIEAGEQNTAVPFAQQCGAGYNVGVARTDWYAVLGTGGPVTITTQGSDYDTAVFVYAGSPAGSLVTCNDDTSDSDHSSSVSFTSTAGATYAVQVGSACNEGPANPCTANPDGGTLKLTATSVTPNHDLDGDGYSGAGFGGPDCNDANPAIHPGAQDVPHDGIDQDCSGKDASYPSLSAVTSTMTVLFFAKYTKASQLKVAGAPVGATVTVSCTPKSKGCPFKRKTVAVKSAKTVLLGSLLKKAKFKKDATVTVLVSKPGFIGSVFRYKIRIKHLPSKTTRCTQPGQTTPRASCS